MKFSNINRWIYVLVILLVCACSKVTVHDFTPIIATIAADQQLSFDKLHGRQLALFVGQSVEISQVSSFPPDWTVLKPEIGEINRNQFIAKVPGQTKVRLQLGKAITEFSILVMEKAKGQGPSITLDKTLSPSVEAINQTNPQSTIKPTGPTPTPSGQPLDLNSSSSPVPEIISSGSPAPDSSASPPPLISPLPTPPPGTSSELLSDLSILGFLSSPTKITLQWKDDKVQNAVGYNLYVNGSLIPPTGTLTILPNNTFEYTFDDLTPQTSYNYGISVINMHIGETNLQVIDASTSTVSMQQPTSQLSVSHGSNVSLQAAFNFFALSPVYSLEFQANGQLLQNSTGQPLKTTFNGETQGSISHSWSTENLSINTYPVKAIARNSSGDILLESDVVNVEVAEVSGVSPPNPEDVFVDFTLPVTNANGQPFGDEITLTHTVPGNTIPSSINTGSSTPQTLSFSNVPIGNYTVTAERTTNTQVQVNSQISVVPNALGFGTVNFLPNPLVLPPVLSSAVVNTDLSGISSWFATGNANDSKGTNHGTFQGTVAFAPGISGEAFSFDGTTSYVSIPDDDALDSDANDSGTIAFWFKQHDIHNGNQVYINKGFNAAFTPPLVGYHLINNGGTSTVDFSVFDGVSVFTASTPETSITVNAWHHLVGVLDRPNNTLTLYLDGNQVDQTDITGLASLATNAPLGFGAVNMDGFGPTIPSFKGEMDEIKYFDTPLNANAVKALYNRRAFQLTGIDFHPTHTSNTVNIDTAQGLPFQSTTTDLSSSIPNAVTASNTSVNVSIGAARSNTLTVNMPPKIESLNINSQRVGAQLIITGAALDANPVVQFNGLGATINSTAANFLRVSVPAGVTKGPVTVTTDHGTAIGPEFIPVPAEANLVNWWRGEGNATDEMSTNHGVINGAVTFTDGKQGQAFDMPGTAADFVQMNYSATNNFPGNAHSIAMWVKSTVVTGDRHFFSYAVPPGGAMFENAVQVAGITDLSKVILNTAMNSGTPINDQKWHHIVTTWQTGGGGATQIYLDGTILTNGTTLGVAFPGNGILVLGQDQDAVGGGFDTAQAHIGPLDEIMIYNTVLSAGQVTDLYNAQK